MSRRILLGGIAAVLAAGALAVLIGTLTSGAASGIPGSAPSIHGTITSLRPSGSAGSVLVEENPADQAGSAKASVTVSATTRIYLGQGTTSRRAQFADLRTGQRVDVWFDGPVATSYPVQAAAAVIVILSS
jgi:hypothetical protein